QMNRMCAPSSVGAIDPVGITNASTTNPRKMNARINATRIASTVSLMLPSSWDVALFAGLVEDSSIGSVYAEINVDDRPQDFHHGGCGLHRQPARQGIAGARRARHWARQSQ